MCASDFDTIMASLTRNSWHQGEVWQFIIKSSANSNNSSKSVPHTFKQTSGLLLIQSQQLSGSFTDLSQGELDPPHLTLVPQPILAWKEGGWPLKEVTQTPKSFNSSKIKTIPMSFNSWSRRDFSKGRRGVTYVLRQTQLLATGMVAYSAYKVKMATLAEAKLNIQPKTWCCQWCLAFLQKGLTSCPFCVIKMFWENKSIWNKGCSQFIFIYVLQKGKKLDQHVV